MAKQKENAVVHSQEQLADGIYSMWINTEAAKDAKPGQFISMYTTDGSKLLPRPISICEIDKENWQKSEIISNVNRNETYTTRHRSLARCLHCNSLHTQMVEFGRRLDVGSLL